MCVRDLAKSIFSNIIPPNYFFSSFLKSNMNDLDNSGCRFVVIRSCCRTNLGLITCISDDIMRCEFWHPEWLKPLHISRYKKKYCHGMTQKKAFSWCFNICLWNVLLLPWKPFGMFLPGVVAWLPVPQPSVAVEAFDIVTVTCDNIRRLWKGSNDTRPLNLRSFRTNSENLFTHQRNKIHAKTITWTNCNEG